MAPLVTPSVIRPGGRKSPQTASRPRSGNCRKTARRDSIRRVTASDEFEVWFDGSPSRKPRSTRSWPAAGPNFCPSSSPPFSLHGVVDFDPLQRAAHRSQRADPRQDRPQRRVRGLRSWLSRERDDRAGSMPDDDQRRRRTAREGLDGGDPRRRGRGGGRQGGSRLRFLDGSRR